MSINNQMQEAHESLEMTFSRAESAVHALKQALWDLSKFPHEDINHYVEEHVGLENMAAWRDQILEDWFKVDNMD